MQQGLRTGHDVGRACPERHAAPAPSRRWSRRLHPGFALGALIEVSALVAILLHRNGHTQGDDFALY